MLLNTNDNDDDDHDDDDEIYRALAFFSEF